MTILSRNHVQGQKKRKVLLKNPEKKEMFKEKIHEELQEDLQQMQLRCKRSLNIDDIIYFKYFPKENTKNIWIRSGI